MAVIRPGIGDPGGARSAPRLPALDGLRGVAAVVVLIHHALLILPWAAEAYYAPDDDPTGLTGLLSYTPLHLVWAGGEAVIVFFVLSGVVLVLPYLGGRQGPRWRSYYPSRLVRLYLPVAASAGLALVLFVVFPRETGAADSAWIQDHDRPVDAATVLTTLALVNGTDMFNSPLWSLRWEVWFSLLLPIYVVVVRSTLVARLLVLPVVVLVAREGTRPVPTALFFLMVFAVGAMLALAMVGREGAVIPKRLGWAAIPAVVLLLSWQWWVRGLGLAALVPWWRPAAVAGAASLIVLALAWEPAGRVLGSRFLVRCGLVSFSLYLVHEPVLVSAALIVPHTQVWLAPILGILVSVPLAVAFFRYVEAPAHLLSVRLRATKKPEGQVPGL